MEIIKKRRSQDALDHNKTYKLSAFLDVDSFFYVVSDMSNRVLMSDVTSTKDLSSQTLSLADLKISKANIAVLNNLFTIVPAEDYVSDDLEALVNHSMDTMLQERFIYKADYHSSADAYVCYAIPHDAYKKCFQVHDLPHIYHGVFALLSDTFGEEGEDLIHLCRQGDKVMMIASKDGRLLAANNFLAKSSMTTLYYSTLLSQTLGLEASKTIIELSGDFIEDGEDAKLINRYFGSLRYRDSKYTLEGKAIDHTSLFFPLQSISRCA